MKKILVFAAHPDDEFLGCGATLLKYRKKGYKIKCKNFIISKALSYCFNRRTRL